MKKLLPFLLALACLFGAAVLPLAAEPIPSAPMIATAVGEIRVAVGHDTVGAAVVLFENGEARMTEGFGYADLGKRTLITPETVFEIGEISSVFVALTAYRMAESGQLSLTADISKYLPRSFADSLGLTHPVTTEQLLMGSAGFEGRTFDLRFTDADYRFDTLESALLAQVPAQIAAPGEFYAYSPFGITLAAYVLECVGGKPYATLAREQVLEPLGMRNTELDPTAESLPEDRAMGYVTQADGSFLPGAGEGRSYSGLYPADGARSDAGDMARLLSFLLNGDPAVMGDDTRAAMLQMRFGDGIFSLSAPTLSVRGQALGRNASTLFFGASLWLDPVSKTGAAVLSNTADSILLSLPAALCGAATGVGVEAGGELPELDTFTGYYADAQSESSSFVGLLLRKDQNIEVTENGDGTLSLLGRRLTQITPGVFADADGDPGVATVQFVLNADGEVERIVTADGDCYLAVGFLEYGFLPDLLFGLLIFLSIWFLGAGIFSLLRYLLARRRRYDDDEDDDAPGLVFRLPLFSAALLAISAFLQILVALGSGAAVFFSFF